jgi:hypothetical protein
MLDVFDLIEIKEIYHPPPGDLLVSLVNLSSIRKLSLVHRPTIEIKEIYHPSPWVVLGSFMNLFIIRNLSPVHRPTIEIKDIYHRWMVDVFDLYCWSIY